MRRRLLIIAALLGVLGVQSVVFGQARFTVLNALATYVTAGNVLQEVSAANPLPVSITGAVAGTGLTFPDGLTGAPSITFTSQTTLGIWREGASALGLRAPSASGVIRLRNDNGIIFSAGTAAADGLWTATNGGYLINTGLTQAALGTPGVGAVVYCTDCNVASAPCTAGGTGTLAVRVNSGTPAWRCL